MDVDGRRFHHVLGRADWERCTVDPPGAAEYSGEAEEMTLAAGTPLFPDRRGNRRPSLSDRRGVDADSAGDVLWIDDAGTGVLVQRSGDGSIAAYWPPEGSEPCERSAARGAFDPVEPCPASRPVPLRGLAVTDDQYMVSGSLEPPGLLVFDLRAGGPPRRLRWPAAAGFRPFDLATRPGGGVFVLERDPPRLWELDRRLVPVADPVAAGLGDDPIAVEALPDGTVLVLDRSGAAPAVRRLRDGAPAGVAPLTGDVSVSAHDMALEAGAGPGPRLIVADARGDQAFSFVLQVDGDALGAGLERRFLPMRSYGGRGVVGTPTGVAYDADGRWMPLVAHPRREYAEHAQVTTPPLDGRDPGCVWHRLVLDACLDEGASIALWSRAADDRADLAGAEWLPEPSPIRRPDGSELPWLESGAHESWELLLQRARGRWLQVRLDLSGDRRATPRVRALRAWYPRRGYRERHLPAVYGEDPESASFLDRFLANPEGIATALEGRIAAAEVLFDPRVAPSGSLDWLAEWVDVALDPTWDEVRRRLALRHAVAIWAMRGTPRGLELTLRLALDPCIDEDEFDPSHPEERRLARIVEGFRRRGLPAVVSGDPTREDGLGGDPPAGVWRPRDGADALDERYRQEVGPGDFPLTRPGEGGDQWTAFARRALGFVPAAGPADLARWREFLSGRYRSVQELDAAHGRLPGYGAFGAVPLPDRVPGATPAAVDWYQFETVVLAARRTAHRFTVLLPVSLDSPVEDGERRREIVERIVRLHAPAHTAFDVRFFWSAFRVGQSRLGEDTVVDLGSRSPALLRPVVLGRRHLGEAPLGGAPAPRLTRPPTGVRRQLVR